MRRLTPLLMAFCIVPVACQGSISNEQGDPVVQAADASSSSAVDAAPGNGDPADAGNEVPADAAYTDDVPGEPASLQGITNAHNNVRQAHGVGPMTWDDDLEAVAQAWANNCEWGHNAGRSDNYPGYVGENIYGSSGTPSGASVTASWASEEADYDYATNTCTDVCGHYTQIVWANSTKLGCAMTNCPGLPYPNFVVCNYAPGGNYNGEKPY